MTRRSPFPRPPVRSGLPPARCVAVALLLCRFPATGPRGAEAPLVLNTRYSPPYSSPEADGILDRLLAEAFGRIGRSAVFRMLPAERSFQDSNNGIADGEIGRIRGVEALYPNLVVVDEPLIESRDFVAFSIRRRFPTPGWEALEPYHVGDVHGWKIFERNARNARSVAAADNTRDLFRMLRDDRIDVALSARLDGLTAARALGIENVRAMEPPLARLKMFLYLHERHREMAPNVARALRSMNADGSFEEIRRAAIRRWLPAK